jgi:hypothetical protein
VLFFFASNVMECLGHEDAWAGKRRAVLPGKKLECGISGGFSSHERKEGPPPTHAKEKMACLPGHKINGTPKHSHPTSTIKNALNLQPILMVSFAT